MRYIKDALKDFQFTPLREGRLALHQIDDAPGRISIHAPPRGATAKASGGLDHILISIHAPPRGATVLERLLVSVGLFQFTPLREGRQQSMQYNMSIRKIISIHAPPRGATAAQMFQAFLGSYFNSRPSARGDVSKSGALVMNEISIHAPPRGATRTTRRSLYADVFQFTPLREGRLFAGGLRKNERHFNSRPSARGDARQMGTFTTTSAFQFTPLREGRRNLSKTARLCIKFQFTPLREGRRGRRYPARLHPYFNSRPSARGDLAHGACAVDPNGFQFTPLREGRPQTV